MPKPRTFDHGFAVDMYLDGLSNNQISLLLGTSVSAVHQAITKAGLTIVDRGRRHYEAWAEKLIAAEAEANSKGAPK